ncbi:gliding motility lipoprotein GldH [Geofilum rhodophaeum]|uniref:gliding motility lipoprotein GldH n=1 Tax=Geofilum rhodophaeum TaxID=1965019 RepID=UPI000B520C7D|nr:gliding motility lipoprotein GldH [Geofilum rhodophaeum]
MDLRRNSWFLLLLPLFWAACSQGELVREEQHFGAGGWHRDQPAVFEVEVQDTTHLLDIGLTLTHGEDYPYSNLWVFVDVEPENGPALRDTLEFFLSETSGEWLGRQRGDRVEVSAYYQHGVRLARPGTYRFSFQQGMRRELLPEMFQIEFWVTTINE